MVAEFTGSSICSFSFVGNKANVICLFSRFSVIEENEEMGEEGQNLLKLEKSRTSVDQGCQYDYIWLNRQV